MRNELSFAVLDIEWHPIGIFRRKVDYKNMKIMDRINMMRRRPGMFVKEERIDYIFYDICGYCHGCYEYAEDDMDKRFYAWFGEWLRLWIVDNFDSEYTQKTFFWYEDIRAIAAQTGQNEATLFYELCDLFFDDYINKKKYFHKENL